MKPVGRIQHGDRIYVAGHGGLAGSAILRCLGRHGYDNIVTRSHAELDLGDQAATRAFFEAERPDVVILAAAKVGGILANSRYPAQFIRQNLAIELNVLHEAAMAGVRHLLFLGSSCIYPRDCPQPIREEYLLTGPLEPSNRPYALAKIAGIEMCDAYNREYGSRYVAVMPSNLYGPGDHYDLADSHVLPALIRKAHEAKEAGAPVLSVWGSGTPRREFLHVDDMAEACLFLLERDPPDFLYNIGTGTDVSIRQLAELVAEIVGFSGGLAFDASKPDGTPRKLLDVSRLGSLGWRSRLGLAEGIAATYEDYRRRAAAGEFA